MSKDLSFLLVISDKYLLDQHRQELLCQIQCLLLCLMRLTCGFEDLHVQKTLAKTGILAGNKLPQESWG